MRLIIGLVLGCSVLGMLGCQSNTQYPSRPITLICPWSAGGGTDAVSRNLAVHLEQELGVPVNVINATGGKGVTGHSRGLRARADGYTLTTITVELNMLHWFGLTNISSEGCAPLISVNEDAAALFVHAESPYQSLAELAEAIQAKPGEFTASGTATGGIWHLALAGWLSSQKLPADAVKWVPNNGANPSLNELGARGVDLVCCSLPEASTYLDSRKIRCLGVMAEKRVAGYEAIPTFAEQGFAWTCVGWRGLAVPRETPKEIQAKLVMALKRIVTGKTQVAGQTFPGFMKQRGFNNTWRDQAEFTKFLAENDRQLGQLLTSEQFASVSTSRFGPYVFPSLLAGLMVLSLAGLVVQARLKPENVSDPSRKSFSHRGWINAALIVAAVIAYGLLAETLGFLLTATIILFVLLVAFGTRWSVALVITIVLVPAVYVLFVHGLRVPFPAGILAW